MKDKSIRQFSNDYNIFLTKNKYSTFKIDKKNSLTKIDNEITLNKSISSKSSNKSVIEHEINKKLSAISCNPPFIKQITDLTHQFKFPMKTKNQIKKNRKFIQRLSLQKNMKYETVYFSGRKNLIYENTYKNNKNDDINSLENIQNDLKKKIIYMKRNAIFLESNENYSLDALVNVQKKDEIQNENNCYKNFKTSKSPKTRKSKKSAATVKSVNKLKKDMIREKQRILQHKKLVYDSFDDDMLQNELDKNNNIFIFPDDKYLFIFDKILFYFHHYIH